MKRTLLSIGEVSRMKGVSPKSLRYYERLGILTPAHIDPHSGYRYYAMNQMIVVDVIVTCIELGIPLKTLTDYVGANGALDIASLLAEGRMKALENIRRARLSLAQIDSYLEEAHEQQHLRACAETPYLRDIGERRILFAPWEGERFDAKRYLSLTTEIYEQAKAARAMPLYQWGMARSPIADGARWYVFVETALDHAEEGEASSEAEQPGIVFVRADDAKKPFNRETTAHRPHPASENGKRQNLPNDRCVSDGPMSSISDTAFAGATNRRHTLDDPMPGSGNIFTVEAPTEANALDKPMPGSGNENLRGLPAPTQSAASPLDGNAVKLSFACIPPGSYRGRRIRENGFEACFRAVFEQAERMPGAIIATEVWDAEMNPSDYVVELLERQ